VKCNVEFININDHMMNIFSQKIIEIEKLNDSKRKNSPIKRKLTQQYQDDFKLKASELISENLEKLSISK